MFFSHVQYQYYNPYESKNVHVHVPHVFNRASHLQVYIDLLMPPMLQKWHSLTDDDKNLFPLLEVNPLTSGRSPTPPLTPSLSPPVVPVVGRHGSSERVLAILRADIHAVPTSHRTDRSHDQGVSDEPGVLHNGPGEGFHDRLARPPQRLGRGYRSQRGAFRVR